MIRNRAIYLLSALALIASLSSCQRGCVRKPPEKISDKRVAQITKWIDPSADVVLIMDLATAAGSETARPWVTWFMHGEFGKIIEGTSYNIKNLIGLVAFQMHVNPDKTFRRVALIQTSAPVEGFVTESAARAAAQGLQIRVLDRFILGVGDAESLATLAARNRGETGASAPEPQEAGAIAWGRVDTTRAVRGMLPAFWVDVKDIAFFAKAGDRLNIGARLNVGNPVHAKIFRATLEGMIAMGAAVKDDAPWLTPLLRSTIVRTDQEYVLLELTIPQEVVMQLPVAGCHLAPYIHFHIADVVAFAIIAGVGIAMVLVLKRRGHNT